MFRRSLRRAGSFVVDPRCRIDWRQSSIKEDQVAIAKARVAKLATFAVARRGEPTLERDDESAFVTSEELTALLEVLVAANEREAITSAVETAREHNVELRPWHYNHLLRSATGVREKAGATHVLQVATGEIAIDGSPNVSSSGADDTYEGTVLGSTSTSSAEVAAFEADTETAACVVTALHHFGVRERCTAIAESIKALIDHGIPLAEPYNVRKDDGSENAQAAVESGRGNAGPPPVYVAPVLSSLLHAFASGCEGPLPSLLVVCFIRLVGAELTLWDYVNLQQALIRDSEAFDSVREVFADAAVMTSATAAGAGPSATGAGSGGNLSFTLSELLKKADRWIAHQTQRGTGGIPARLAVVQQCRLAAVTRVVELIRHWWSADGRAQIGADDCTVYVGFVGAPMPTLEALLRLIDTEATRRKTIGATGDSAVCLLHARALMYHVTSNKIGCVRELSNIHRIRGEWLKKYSDGSDYVTSLQLSNPHASASTSSPSLRVRQGKPTETFRTVMQYPTADFTVCDLLAIKDIANFFPEVPSVVRNGAAEPFNAMLQRSISSGILTVNESRILWALSIPLVRNLEEATAAIEYIRENSVHFRQLLKAVKAMIRSLILTVALHPPANAKMSPEAVMERRRWGVYCEARDISLTVYGQTRNGKEQMKQLFHSGNRFPALRSTEAIRTDVVALKKVFELSGTPLPETAKYPTGSSWLDFALPRTVAPLFEEIEDVVPKHLHDPKVYNPYPQAAMQITKTKEPMPDLFPALQGLLAQLGDPWWLTEPNTFVNLLRCYIHRLDWTGAIKVTEQAFKTLTMTSAIDAEIQRMFNEIGDPQGSLAFKAASKIVDLRIKEKARGGAAPEA